MSESTADQFLLTEREVPLVTIFTKGFWSQERQIDFERMYRRLSVFGIFGLDYDLFIREPAEIDPNNSTLKSDIAKKIQERD